MRTQKLEEMMTPELRSALITVLRYELRANLTIEAAAEQHGLSVEFAKKATRPRRLRRKKGDPIPASATPSDSEESITLTKLAEQTNALEATVYELIDMVEAVKARGSPTL